MFPRPWITMRFAMLGPFVGNIAYAVTEGFFTKLGGQHPSVWEMLAYLAASIPKALLMAVLGCFIAYPIGIIPAIIAGMGYSKLLWHLDRGNPSVPMRLLYGGLTGALSAGLFGAVLFSTDTHGAWRPESALAWTCAGALGGAASAMSVSGVLFQLTMGRAADGCLQTPLETS